MLRLFVPLLALLGFAGAASAADMPAKSPDWAMKATIIEACSCPMFCQCYFNGSPSSHAAAMGAHEMAMAGHEHGAGGETYCRFNNAFRVDKGNYGATKLDGAKFWVAGDLGAEFTDGEMEWAVVHFDPAVTKEQREGVAAILGNVYPVKWKAFSVGEDAPISWIKTKEGAHALLADGKLAEVDIRHPAGRMSSAEPMVIKNLKYWGAPRNDGFVLMGPNAVEAYRAGDKAFEYKGTNGFMITFDISSKDVAAAAPAKGGGGY